MIKMKDSGVTWIGEIPNDWETRKIKQIVDYTIENSFIDGDWIESPYVEDSGIRYLTTGNIGDGYFKEQGNGYISLETFSALNCKYAYPDDLVISRLNSPYGRSCILPNTHDKYVLAVDNVILRPISNKKYLCYVTQCSGYQTSVMENAKGTTMKRISRTNLGNVVIPFPPIDYQNRIADYLDKKCAKIDAIIEKQRAVIEKLKEYKLSIITEAVTLGLNKNVDLKDSQIAWIGNINNSYSLSRVGAFSFVTKLAGFEYTDTMVNAISPDETIPIVRAQNVRMFKFNDNNISEYIGEDISKSLQRCALDKKAVLITFIGAGIGDVCIFDKENRHHLAPNVAKIEIRDEFKNILLEEFLMYYLGSYAGKGEIQKISKASAQPSLSMGTIRGIKIVLPTIEEQHKIVNYLNEKCQNIDKLILSKEEVIQKLSEYKKSLIYEVVTGKKEV